MELEEFQRLKIGDWIENIEGDVGMIHHFAGRGINKPFIKIHSRRALACKYVKILPQREHWHYTAIRQPLPVLQAKLLRKVAEKLEILEKLVKGGKV